MQRHEYSIDINAPLDEVWELFWYRAPDRPQPPPPRPGEKIQTRINILHPGDDVGEGLVRHCTFPVPKWLLSGGEGNSWEWLTQVKYHDSWVYDAIGKPLWSKAHGETRLVALNENQTRIYFSETYTAFNPIMAKLFERRVHRSISRDNDAILAAIEGGIKWHRKRRAREAQAAPVESRRGNLSADVSKTPPTDIPQTRHD